MEVIRDACNKKHPRGYANRSRGRDAQGLYYRTMGVMYAKLKAALYMCRGKVNAMHIGARSLGYVCIYIGVCSTIWVQRMCYLHAAAVILCLFI